MKRIILFACTMMLGWSCYPKKEEKQTELIDSTVVGKDTNSVDVRRDIELSDENKRVLPDEATEPTKSDEAPKAKNNKNE